MNSPTYENQLQHARQLLKEKGALALYNPHAATGKICGCGSCFCCAALQVYTEVTQVKRNIIESRRNHATRARERGSWEV